MSLTDVLRFTAISLRGHRLRALLTLAAMAIGVAAVVVLTALGEGARRYVTEQFAALGTHLLIVLPGRAETVGSAPPLLAETPRDLTVDDAQSLTRSSAVRYVAPIAVGAAEVSYGSRSREVMIMGATAELAPVRHLEMASGSFLPPGRPDRQAPLAVLGATVRDELFGAESPLGRFVRIADRRYRVIGVLGSRGRSIGLDLDEMVVIPVASAQALFDTWSLFRVLIEATTREAVPRARDDVLAILRERHDGEEDVTIITQDAVLGTFDRLLRALTFSVGGIAAISLVVAGVLVMNVMLVSVVERTAEIGLLQALGAPRGQVLVLFLTEAGLLSASGGALGLAVGVLGAFGLGRIYPQLPIQPPAWAAAAALATALVTGLAFGVIPARRAARLDPVAALAR